MYRAGVKLLAGATALIESAKADEWPRPFGDARQRAAFGAVIEVGTPAAA
jgi:hypothetical protein